jgi:hypothetical protein
MNEVERLKRDEKKIIARILFWAANMPVILLLYVFARSVWLEASLLYLALVSVQNNLETAYASLTGKRAERRSLENPPADSGD